MSDWSIRVPYRDRDDLVLDAITAARDSQLAEQEVRVVDVLARDALGRGITTVGGLLDELGQLDRSETRRRFDWAREKAGLISATDADRRREDARWESAWQRLQPPGPPRWSELQRCPQCGRYPTKDGGGAGAWAPVSVERWWCPEHEHLAAEGDMDEHEAPYVGIGLTGRPIPSAKEAARIEAWLREREEEEARERQAREEYEQREYEATEAARERVREEGEISILGVRCRPDGRIIQ